MSYSHAKQAHSEVPGPDIRLATFITLGKVFADIARALRDEHPPASGLPAALDLYTIARNSPKHNPWFSIPHVTQAIAALGYMLREESLKRWLEPYLHDLTDSKKILNILVIMAGNIPLVGFHDFLTVLISGHRFVGKLSSQDRELPPAVGRLLSEIEPAFKPMMSFHESKLPAFDALIATGSDNTARYFRHHFGHYPHIIRKNRTSIAVLDGQESSEELNMLGADIFSYHGKGCRNVSQLWLPSGFNPEILGPAWASYAVEASHHKFMNNYLYRKALYRAENTIHTDTGFCLLLEDQQAVSPLSVIHFQYYEDIEQVKAFIRAGRDVIQAVIAAERIFSGSVKTIPPGKGQLPEPWDYADGIDTMDFLIRL